MADNKKQNEKTYTQTLFNMGFILLIIIIVIVPLYYMGIVVPSDFLPGCFFHRLTGYSCLGCGCTRAVRALFNGKIIESLKYNPIIIYFFVIYIPFMITNTIAVIKNLFYIKSCIKKETGVKYPVSDLLNELLPYHGMIFRNIYFYVGGAIVVVFGITRLICEIVTSIK